MKKYKRPIKRSFRVLSQNQLGQSSDESWSCSYCQLTFTNAEVLNIHTLTHASEYVDWTGMLAVSHQVDNDELEAAKTISATTGGLFIFNDVRNVELSSILFQCLKKLVCMWFVVFGCLKKLVCVRFVVFWCLKKLVCVRFVVFWCLMKLVCIWFVVDCRRNLIYNMGARLCSFKL